MPRNDVSPQVRKHLPDLLAGLAVFALLLAVTGGPIGPAAAADTQSLGAVMDHDASALLLAGAFAAMAVFNVAFVRHLRRAYTPRRAALPHRRQSDKNRGA